MRSIGIEPFVFYSIAHIVELTGRRARTLRESAQGIRRASYRDWRGGAPGPLPLEWP